MKNYYQILGISKDASLEEIKKVYRVLAMKWHPDRNPDNIEAEEKFKEISEAYAVLIDETQRKKYDSENWGRFTLDQSWMDDLLHRGSSEPTYSSPARKGSNLEIPVWISLKEAAIGFAADLDIKRMEVCLECNNTGKIPIGRCPECEGTGQSIPWFTHPRTSYNKCLRCGGTGKNTRSCSKCHGVGSTYLDKKLHVKIPANLKDGLKVRLAKQGHCGFCGGESGDAYIIIRIRKDKFFIRKQNDVYCCVNINFVDAILGASIKIPTIKGDLTSLKIPAGTQSGTSLSIKNKGFEGGDMHIRVFIKIPTKITKNQKQLLKAFQKAKL